MDSDTFETNLKTLKELVLDEHKLVTYIYLSKELCIHVNEAKYLMSRAVEDIRKAQPNTGLNINYIISGLVDNNRARTIVCSDTDLVSHRNTLKTVFFQHIYSISQGAPCVDNIAYVAINNFEDFTLCTGLIKGNSCFKRTLDEIGNLKTNSLEAVQDPKSNNLLPVKKERNGFEDFKKVTETKTEPIIKTEISLSKKELLSTSNDKLSNTKNEKKPTRSIAGFFTKANSVLSTKTTTKVDKEIVQEKIVKAENKDVRVDDNMEVDEDIPVVKVKKEAINSSKENSKKNNSLNQMRKNAKVDKKRKRVLHVSDSDSGNEFNDPFADEKPVSVDHGSEDEIPPTPLANTVKIASGILNPKKRRKIVDKTYTDEDGYILTRKEEVYESCSENEEEVVNTKENVEQVNLRKIEPELSPKEKKIKNKKKVSPPQKGKQATLMNFFKKFQWLQPNLDELAHPPNMSILCCMLMIKHLGWILVCNKKSVLNVW